MFAFKIESLLVLRFSYNNDQGGSLICYVFHTSYFTIEPHNKG